MAPSFSGRALGAAIGRPCAREPRPFFYIKMRAIMLSISKLVGTRRDTQAPQLSVVTHAGLATCLTSSQLNYGKHRRERNQTFFLETGEPPGETCRYKRAPAYKKSNWAKKGPDWSTHLAGFLVCCKNHIEDVFLFAMMNITPSIPEYKVYQFSCKSNSFMHKSYRIKY